MSAFRYLYNEALVERDGGILCPEKPERLRRLHPDRMTAAIPGLVTATFDAMPAHILSPVHETAYIENVRTAYRQNLRALDSGDTRVTPNIFEDALLSASAGCAAVDGIAAGQYRRAFCAVRPPGHHANALRALGFCIFNNAAVAARYAQRRHNLKRVLLLDWDIHPGNGTQEIFYEDPSVFTLSFHQAGLLGESGEERLTGRGDGEGFNRNVAFAAGTAANEYLDRFNRVVNEICEGFRPKLLIISAGFDAHARDPASQLQIAEADFGAMTRLALDAADPHTGGRTVSLLEGGYNLVTLEAGVTEHCRAMLTHRAPNAGA